MLACNNKGKLSNYNNIYNHQFVMKGLTFMFLSL
uniref:Uncharacterized protein n=1 Tax=Anguilla anguilla TaxID=7936 RepID=A0A0E9TE14_ANGAN